MTGSWCLVASVLVNAYSCNLISYLTVPKYKPIVQSLEDVAANPDMQFAVDAGTVLADRTLVCDEIKLLQLCISNETTIHSSRVECKNRR